METIKLKDGSLSFKEKVYLPDGSTVTKTFKRKTDAKSWKAIMESQKIRGELQVKEVNEKLFKDLAEDWFKRMIMPCAASKTKMDYLSVLNSKLIPMFGHKRVIDISVVDADTLVGSLKSKGRANKTINRIVGLFKQILFFAEREEIIVRSRLTKYRSLPLAAKQVDYLSRAEVEQLLRANYFSPFYSVLLIAVNCGLRIGEIAGLCWDRIDFGTKTITISRTMTNFGLQETTKTNLIRYIPMNTVVEKHLQNLRKQQRNLEYVCVDEKGACYRPNHISARQFKKSLELAKVRRVRFHDLRHTFASMWVTNGGGLYELQKILGHTKFEMTAKYAHLNLQHLSEKIHTVCISGESEKVSPLVALR